MSENISYTFICIQRHDKNFENGNVYDILLPLMEKVVQNFKRLYFF